MKSLHWKFISRTFTEHTPNTSVTNSMCAIYALKTNAHFRMFWSFQHSSSNSCHLILSKQNFFLPVSFFFSSSSIQTFNSYCLCFFFFLFTLLRLYFICVIVHCLFSLLSFYNKNGCWRFFLAWFSFNFCLRIMIARWLARAINKRLIKWLSI